VKTSTLAERRGRNNFPNDTKSKMGHGKNKKTQKVGLGQERKETKEERRLRLEEEAKAREVSHKRAACDQSTPFVLAGMSKTVVVRCADILTL